jgi:hypothetical protein
MSLAEMRKELKEIRKKSSPVPISRMKKADCAAELARLKGLHSVEEKKVAEVVADAPKKVAKKVESVQKVEHKKQEDVVKKTKGVKAPKEDAPKEKEKGRPAKGSDEMKAKMAKLREARMAKKKAE